MSGLPDDPRLREELLGELDALLESADDARQARLDALRADRPELAAALAALLAADRRFGGFLEEPLGNWAGALVPGPDAGGSSFEGRILGAWRLGPLLGAGGMGLVHVAERCAGDFAQSAAVKVLARSDVHGDLAARFRRERAILARLTHPGITRLLDGGVSDDGWPWFALELVQGAPLTDHCRERAADVRMRLRLIRQVADAVAHAHRHLIVHGDLKPSNILVDDDGCVKLLDFGIAKLLADDDGADLTLAGRRPFTPRYAAPEQVTGGAITTATDIYALGAVLYELLCGRSPHGGKDVPEHELLRAAAELDPAPLTRAARDAVADAAGVGVVVELGRDRLLAGDLQNIVARCLAKDPAGRYASVDALLDDLRRAEAGEPVQARPPSRRYVLAKLVRRNRVAVAAGALVLVALVGGLATTAWQARRAAREAARAEQARAFLLDLFAAADPSATPGREVTAREILRRGAGDLRGKLAEQPALRAELLVTVGELLRLVGAHADADTVLGEALTQAEAVHGPWSPAVARVADALGGVVYELGRFERAEALYRRALAIHERAHGRRHVATAASLANLAGVLSQAGDPAASEGLYREVLAIDLELLGPDDPAIGTDLNNLAVCLYRAGRAAEADSRGSANRTRTWPPACTTAPRCWWISVRPPRPKPTSGRRWRSVAVCIRRDISTSPAR
ncbi:serine/threonine protein kinase [bacterium]|nr:serine/threonine protein kinase [bacterium]